MNQLCKKPICVLLLFILTMSCAHMRPAYQPEKSKSGKMYTAYNMWYEKPHNMYCINYQKGTLLPAGTEVKKIKVVSRQRELDLSGRPFSPSINFKVVSTGQIHKVIYKHKFHPNKSVKDYADLMFTEKAFTELTNGMSKKEIILIKRGLLAKGMSKKAVIAAVGVPPDHRTPDLKSNTWVYWMNRFKSKNICFNSDNITIKCSELLKEEFIEDLL